MTCIFFYSASPAYALRRDSDAAAGAKKTAFGRDRSEIITIILQMENRKPVRGRECDETRSAKRVREEKKIGKKKQIFRKHEASSV